MTTDVKQHQKVYPFTIDGKPYQFHEQFIIGAVIRKMGNIPADYEIFLKVNGPIDDKLILDKDKVDLSEKGTEHFYSCKPNTKNG